VVVEADDACHLPYAILVLPDVNEPGFRYRLGIFMSRVMSGVMKAMRADLYGAKVTAPK
jgi:hypothetical protein